MSDVAVIWHSLCHYLPEARLGSGSESGPSALVATIPCDDDLGMLLIDDRTGLERLTRDECVELLRGAQVGRLAVVANARPLIFPVNYAMDGEVVVFRTAAGTKFDAAVREMAVAFEVDEFDRDARAGWSVLVSGRAEEVVSESHLARLKNLPLRPWATGEKDNWLVITATAITGRRIVPD